MSYTVRVHPGPITCGKCGHPMHAEGEPKHINTSTVISCLNSRCEQYDVLLKFPMPLTELEKA